MEVAPAKLERHPTQIILRIEEGYHCWQIFGTSLTVIIGVLLILRRASSKRRGKSKVVSASKPLRLQPEEEEIEIVVGKTKITILFGTQTGTAEGFAKPATHKNALGVAVGATIGHAIWT